MEVVFHINTVVEERLRISVLRQDSHKLHVGFYLGVVFTCILTSLVECSCVVCSLRGT